MRCEQGEYQQRVLGSTLVPKYSSRGWTIFPEMDNKHYQSTIGLERKRPELVVQALKRLSKKGLGLSLGTLEMQLRPQEDALGNGVRYGFDHWDHDLNPIHAAVDGIPMGGRIEVATYRWKPLTFGSNRECE